MKKIILFIVCTCSYLLLSCTAQHVNTVLLSPDGTIMVNVYDADSLMHYEVMLNGNVMLEKSPLGLVTEKENFATHMKLDSVSGVIPVMMDYNLTFGKTKHVHALYNQKVYYFSNPNGKKLALTFRVNDGGVAFSYTLDGSGKDKVMYETTAYQLPSIATAFISPMAKAKTGWENTNPSYEDQYQRDAPLGIASEHGAGWVYPALFKIQHNGWVLLSETGVDGNYVATHLAENSQNGLYKVEFPHIKENVPTDPSYAEVTLPFTTPWRTINVGASLQPIVASTLAQDLVTPQYTSQFQYKAGKAAWSWLTLKDDNITFDVQKEYINMASQLHFEYCLIDNWWDQKIGKKKIEELAKYAQTKNVSLILWYNSNGQWNNAPQTPKNCMDTRAVRREELAWLQKTGIKGIKVDFFGGDKQRVMKLYEDILKDANDFGIAVNFHGCTLPRGWDRMYPNFVTDEAVMGMEYCTFTQDAENKQPQHCTTLPFTRNSVAPMDFTPTVLHLRLGDKPETGPTRITKAAFELALPVVFYSAIQHLGVAPTDLKMFPGFVWNYLSAVPTIWDETVLVEGYPGKEVVIARRAGTRWYIAGINGENTAKDLSLNLNFLKGESTAQIIKDKNDTAANEVIQNTITINPNQSTSIHLAPYGGFIITVSSAEK